MTGPAGLPIGVLGVGSLGFHHARILGDLPGSALVGIHDSNPERARSVADQLGTRAFDSPEELLARVEAAVVAVPTTVHAGVALEAIDRGVHLLIEKPITATLEEAELVLSRAEERGVVVATGHVERFNAALRACEPYLDEPLFVESHRLASFGPRGTDVAVVLDLMIHDIDLVLSLMGASVSTVDAIGVPVLTTSVDIANARLVFEGGQVANITASRVSQDRMRKIRLFQRSGYISLDLARGAGEFLRIRPGARLSSEAPVPTSLLEIVERVELQGDGKEPLRSELEGFVGALRGEGGLVVSGREGQRALAVALQIVNRIETYVTAPHPA